MLLQQHFENDRRSHDGTHKDKRKGKGKCKNKAKRLKPTSGWEDWPKGKKLRRNLKHDYDTN